MKTKLIVLVTFLVIVLSLISFATNSDNNRYNPNIVIIFTDDQGYGDIGCYGATGYETPNLDKLASQGIRFTNNYVAQPVCSASRAGLLTGCYPNRIGISGALFPYTKVGINENEITIAEMLKSKGYSTAIFGKWHLGHHKKFLPLQHGFDEYLGIPYSNDMWPIDIDGNQIEHGKGRGKFPHLPIISGNEKIEEIKSYEGQNKLTTLYTEKAVDFINRKKDKPFFLYVPHSMPHIPLGVSDKFKGKSEQGMYGDVMMEIDWSVGKIVKALKENEIDDNTIVIFTTDNGPWLNYGNHGGSSGGLREGKGTNWEGGQRVPLILRWPGMSPAGFTCNKLVSTLDILPTIAEIVNGELPDHKIDGVNVVNLWKGDFSENPRKELYYYYGKNNLNAVRSGNWKLVLPHTFRSYHALPGNDGRGGPRIKAEVDTMQLYNLMRDPGEEYNVIELYPILAEELLKVAEKARDELGDLNIGIERGVGNREVGTL